MESLTEIDLELFIVRGCNGTSMGRIAKAAGITKPVINRHLASKEKLLKIALSRALGLIFDGVHGKRHTGV